MNEIPSKPSHGTPIGIMDGKPVNLGVDFQNFFDELEQKLNDFLLGAAVLIPSYTVATLPTLPDATTRGIIFVSDLAGQAAPVYWEGTNWRRFSDDTVAS